LLLQPKILLQQQPNFLLIELNILLLWQNIFVIPILTKDFVGITKPFIPCTTNFMKEKNERGWNTRVRKASFKTRVASKVFLADA